MKVKKCVSDPCCPKSSRLILTGMGQPGYRAGQVFRWLSQGVCSFDEMSDLPKSLRAQLEQQAYISRPEIVRKQVSARDGTIKYLFGLAGRQLCGNSGHAV